jgi:hypothetical protein
LSEDGTASIAKESWTEDGQILAYAISEKGSDLLAIKVGMLFIKKLKLKIIFY